MNSRSHISRHIPRLRRDLLAWYDQTGRVLPWRVRPEDREKGLSSDPYAIWLSEIMMQQTTIAHGTPYWEKFLKRFPSVFDLAGADRDEIMAMWAGLGYYARARNLHKCAQIIRDEFGGEFPPSEKALLKLPGIGPYTAATIAAICFNEATNIVDGNVERVISRVYAESAPLPKSKRLLRELAAPIADPERPGDYGQALMDLGGTVCTPQTPDCAICPWQFACKAYADGNPDFYPQKIKKNQPIRYGAAFALICDGSILLRRRPDNGLLGGMLELPGTPWEDKLTDNPLVFAPLDRNWERCNVVKHVFTHFDLRLEVYRAEISTPNLVGSDEYWVPLDDLMAFAIPTLTKKAILLATKM